MAEGGTTKQYVLFEPCRLFYDIFKFSWRKFHIPDSCIPDLSAINIYPSSDFISTIARPIIVNQLKNRDVLRQFWDGLSEEDQKDIHYYTTAVLDDSFEEFLRDYGTRPIIYFCMAVWIEAALYCHYYEKCHTFKDFLVDWFKFYHELMAEPRIGPLAFRDLYPDADLCIISEYFLDAFIDKWCICYGEYNIEKIYQNILKEAYNSHDSFTRAPCPSNIQLCMDSTEFLPARASEQFSTVSACEKSPSKPKSRCARKKLARRLAKAKRAQCIQPVDILNQPSKSSCTEVNLPTPTVNNPSLVHSQNQPENSPEKINSDHPIKKSSTKNCLQTSTGSKQIRFDSQHQTRSPPSKVNLQPLIENSSQYSSGQSSHKKVSMTDQTQSTKRKLTKASLMGSSTKQVISKPTQNSSTKTSSDDSTANSLIGSTSFPLKRVLNTEISLQSLSNRPFAKIGFKLLSKSLIQSSAAEVSLQPFRGNTRTQLSPEPPQASSEHTKASPQPAQASPEPPCTSPEPPHTSPEPPHSSPEPPHTSPEPPHTSPEPPHASPEPLQASPESTKISPASSSSGGGSWTLVETRRTKKSSMAKKIETTGHADAGISLKHPAESSQTKAPLSTKTSYIKVPRKTKSVSTKSTFPTKGSYIKPRLSNKGAFKRAPRSTELSPLNNVLPRDIVRSFSEMSIQSSLKQNEEVNLHLPFESTPSTVRLESSAESSFLEVICHTLLENVCIELCSKHPTENPDEFSLEYPANSASAEVHSFSSQAPSSSSVVSSQHPPMTTLIDSSQSHVDSQSEEAIYYPSSENLSLQHPTESSFENIRLSSLTKSLSVVALPNLSYEDYAAEVDLPKLAESSSANGKQLLTESTIADIANLPTESGLEVINLQDSPESQSSDEESNMQSLNKNTPSEITCLPIAEYVPEPPRSPLHFILFCLDPRGWIDENGQQIAHAVSYTTEENNSVKSTVLGEQ